MSRPKQRNITVPLGSEVTVNVRFMGKVKSIFSKDDDVWLLDDKDRAVVYNAKEDSVRSIILLEENVSDFSLSPTTGNVWFCSQRNNSIWEMETESERKILRFEITDQPLSVCVTSEDTIVVGVAKGLCIYTSDGTKLCAVDLTVRTPHRIAECPVTKNIAIIDLDWKSHGGSLQPKVVVFDKCLNVQHIYTGRRKYADERISLDRLELAFSPRGVCYSKTGDIFIGDYYNHSVIRTSGTGEYLGESHLQSPTPTVVYPKSDDELWAIFQHDWLFGYKY